MLFPFIQPQVYCIPTNVEEFTDLSFFSACIYCLYYFSSQVIAVGDGILAPAYSIIILCPNLCFNCYITSVAKCVD
jgi:hypothetical protein